MWWVSIFPLQGMGVARNWTSGKVELRELRGALTLRARARDDLSREAGRRGRIRSRAGARPPLVVWEVRKSGSWIGLGKADLYHMLWFWGRSDLPVGSFCQKLFLLDAVVGRFWVGLASVGG